MQASLAAGASVNAQYEQLARKQHLRAAARFNGRAPVSADGRCRCTPGLKVQRRQTRASAVVLAHRHLLQLLGPPYPRVRDKYRPSCSPALVCPAPAVVGVAQRQGRSLAAEQEPLSSNQRTPQFSGVHRVNPLREVMPSLSLPPNPSSRAVMQNIFALLRYLNRLRRLVCSPPRSRSGSHPALQSRRQRRLTRCHACERHGELRCCQSCESG